MDLKQAVKSLLAVREAKDTLRQMLWDEYRKDGMPYGVQEEGFEKWLQELRVSSWWEKVRKATLQR